MSERCFAGSERNQRNISEVNPQNVIVSKDCLLFIQQTDIYWNEKPPSLCVMYDTYVCQSGFFFFKNSFQFRYHSLLYQMTYFQSKKPTKICILKKKNHFKIKAKLLEETHRSSSHPNGGKIILLLPILTLKWHGTLLSFKNFHFIRFITLSASRIVPDV